MARVVLPKTNLRERRRRRRIAVALLSAGVLLLVLATFVGLSWIPYIRISMVVVDGTHAVPPERVQQLAAQDLSGGYLHLFARSNIFLYPKGALTHDLLVSFPTLKTVTISAESFRSIDVTVTERTPVALWCGSAVASSSDCYLIDKDGVVYAPAVIYSGDAYERYFGTVVGGQLPMQYLTLVQFQTLFALVGALQQKIEQLPGEDTDMAQTIFVDTNGDAHVTFGSGFELIFATGQDSSLVLSHLALALTADPFLKHPLAAFEYLDLRFGDKLYYRLRS